MVAVTVKGLSLAVWHCWVHYMSPSRPETLSNTHFYPAGTRLQLGQEFIDRE